MNEAERVEMQVERKGDAVTVTPIGEIDLSCSVSMRQQLREIQAAKPARLVINLEQVPYMDSSGVATLVEIMQTARRNKCTLVLCCLQPKVRSVFEIAKLDTVFTIVENADIAHSV